MATETVGAAVEYAGHPEHFVRFYDDDALLLGEVSDFLDMSLRAGGGGIVIATPEHLHELKRRLSGFGAEPGRKIWSNERLVTLDAQTTLDQFMVDNWPDEAQFDAVVGEVVRNACSDGRAVNAFGEMVALLCAQGLYDAAIRLEEMWNALSEKNAFSLFCAYPWKLFPDAELSSAFQKVCATHDHASGAHARHGESTEPKEVSLRLAQLEQKARAMETEIGRRREAEQTLKQREKELEDFLENSAEGLHRVGDDGTILWANKAELHMLGYRWEEYVGQKIADFHVDLPAITDILARVRAGETLYDYPARLKCKDGSIKHVLIHSNGCFEEGRLRYTRCFTRDATERFERDKAYAEREKLLAELSRANQAKDEFLAMLGHELRNPLAPISLALELMRIRGDVTSQREQEIIARQVAHMTRLVDDLLDISRITRGRIELQVAEISISQVVTKAIELASPLLENKNHQLKVDVDRALRMNGDPVRIAQLVANLLTNAARYTDNGGQIELSARQQDGHKVCIRVSDNGAGIPEEMLSQIFELFYQGKQSIDRAQGGLGIGLSLVKNIVALHRGTVEARSEGLGRGSEFIVTMPVKSLPLSAAPFVTADAATMGAQFCKRRVLLVDDNIDVASTLGCLIEAVGHEVAVFNDPVEALAAAAQIKPEIVILDIGLPTLNGYDLAIQIRAALGSSARCRFIAVTGYGQEADKAQSRAAGFDQHLVKPIDQDQLLRLIAGAETGA